MYLITFMKQGLIFHINVIFSLKKNLETKRADFLAFQSYRNKNVLKLSLILESRSQDHQKCFFEQVWIQIISRQF